MFFNFEIFLTLFPLYLENNLSSDYFLPNGIEINYYKVFWYWLKSLQSSYELSSQLKEGVVHFLAVS